MRLLTYISVYSIGSHSQIKRVLVAKRTNPAATMSLLCLIH